MKYILVPLTLLAFSLHTQAQDIASNATTAKDNELYYFSSDTIKTENDTVKKRKGQELDEVIVTGNKPKKTINALRSGLKPMDVPQNVQIIDAEVIDQQQAIRLSEVLKNANGINVSSARGGAQESFSSRGYSMGSSNMLKNGFRYNSGSIPDVSGLERVEFLKGGAALLYGNIAPGGVLNLITKAPSFQQGGSLSMQAGSYAYYKPSLDFYGPLNKNIAYRINASYENSESFRDVVKNERFYVNPSLLFNITDKTHLTVQGDYLNADWTPDFGTGIIGTEILDLPRNEYFGALWSTGNTKSASASVLLNHDFNKNWKLNFNASYQTYDRSQLSTAQLSGLDNKTTYPVAGTWNRGLTQSKSLEETLGDQLSLQGTFNTGSIKHQIFTGLDWDNAFSTSNTYTFDEKNVKDNKGKYLSSAYDAIYLFDFDSSTQRNDVPVARNSKIGNTETSRFGVYFQDLISLTEKIKVLAGIRWSWQEVQSTTYEEKYDTKTEIQTLAPENAEAVVGAMKIDNAFSPKIGIVYQPTTDLSLFASYSNSFSPNSGTTINLEPLKPSIIDQYEVGLKKDFWKGKMSTNLSVYQITNSNLAQMAEFNLDGSLNSNSNLKVLNGESKSKGVEVDITARPIDGLSIIAGYSYNDYRYAKTSGLNGSPVEGSRLVGTPANTGNLSFFYTLPTGTLKGVSFGAIGNYIGKRVGGWNDQNNNNIALYPDGIYHREIPLDGYATVDFSAGYSWEKLSLLVKLSNITNELDYTVHENYSVNPIAPRQVMASLKYRL